MAFSDVILLVISKRQHTRRPIQQVFIKHLTVQHVRILDFYTIPLQVNMARIKVSIPGLKLGFPHPVSRTSKGGKRKIPSIKYACPEKTRIRAFRPRSLIPVLIQWISLWLLAECEQTMRLGLHKVSSATTVPKTYFAYSCDCTVRPNCVSMKLFFAQLAELHCLGKQHVFLKCRSDLCS